MVDVYRTLVCFIVVNRLFPRPRPFGYLCAVPSLVPSLQAIAASYDISPALRYLLPHLIPAAITQKGN